MDAFDACKTALTDYFQSKVVTLFEDYNWSIPSLHLSDSITNGNSRGYRPNIELKSYLHDRWKNADTIERYGLAIYVVNCWGGVKSNKTGKIIQYVNEITQNSFSNPFEGIASYSKIRSIENPYKFAIFDARVATALNAVQWNAGHHRTGLAFHYPDGRNKITGNAGNKTGFAYTERFKPQSLMNSGWALVPKDRTYVRYIELLNACLEELKSRDSSFNEHAIYDLEMVLFANAERECAEAMGLLLPTQKSRFDDEKLDSSTTRTTTSRRPKMNFAAMKMPVGSVLLFKDKRTEVIVVSDRKVRWNNQNTSLYNVTKQLTGKANPGQPSTYWTFDGRNLKKIYEDSFQDSLLGN